MYDIVTTTLLFFLLVPGVVLTLPPGGSPLVAGLVHAVVFFAVLRWVSMYVPWWGIWVIAAVVILGKLYMSRPAPPPPMY